MVRLGKVGSRHKTNGLGPYLRRKFKSLDHALLAGWVMATAAQSRRCATGQPALVVAPGIVYRRRCLKLCALVRWERATVSHDGVVQAAARGLGGGRRPDGM